MDSGLGAGGAGIAAGGARLVRRLDANPHVLASLAYVYGLSGQPEQAARIVAMLDERRSRGVWVSNYDRAVVQAGSGDHNAGLELLKTAIAEREPWLVFMKVDPRLGGLSKEPAFDAIAEKVFSGSLIG